ncbi:MAG: class I SAM-dependent RNA methyltransferase [Chthoniobacterales bacterium]
MDEIAFGGSGIARDEGKAVFVPFTIDGERVSARLVRQKKQFAEAELVEVLDSSAHRVEPRCPYFGRCGGCAYQHISYAHQLEIKTRQVEQTLRRIGKLSDVPMRPIVPSPAEYEYRNRVTVHAQNGTIGFYRRNSHRLLDITHCPISRPEVNRALTQLRAARPRDGHYSLRANEAPRVFEQTNDAVAAELRELVAGFFPERRTLLIDAFCGSGFFAKRLIERFDRVLGIEWDRFAVELARQQARPNESYLNSDVEIELLVALQNAPRDAAVLVDPPATGLGAAARAALQSFPPQTLVYVSCNPATLARDLGELRAQFRMVSVTPLDMFPQTAEIEVAAHLERA